MADQLVKVFDALSNETRLTIVRDFLAGHDSICPSIKKQIAKSQPTLSHHIGKLVDANILIESKKGTNCYYKVNKLFLKNMGINIDKMTKEIKNG